MLSGPAPAPFAWLFERYGEQNSLFMEEEQPIYSERWYELYQEHFDWTNVKPHHIRCNCRRRVAHIDKINYLVCGSCGLYTHRECVKAGVSTRLGLDDICNECRCAIVKGLIEMLKDAVPTDNDLKKIALPPDLFSYVVESLWTIYCNLPNDNDTPNAVLRATRLCYAADKFVPVHEASLQWAERVHQEILAVLEYLPPIKCTEIFEDQVLVFDDTFFSRLRRAVVWGTKYGYFVKEEEEIGLLTEIIGLYSKGHFWKGTWPRIDPKLHAILERQSVWGQVRGYGMARG